MLDEIFYQFSIYLYVTSIMRKTGLPFLHLITTTGLIIYILSFYTVSSTK